MPDPLPHPDVPTVPALAPPKRDAARRVLFAGRIGIGGLTVVLLLLLGRVAQLQQTPDARVLSLLQNQASQHPLAARRGMLLDRRGRPLANTRVAFRLFADPAILDDPAALSMTVGYTLDYDPIQLEKKLAQRPGSRYVILDPRVPDDKIDHARNLVVSMRGLSLEPYLVRDYPQGPLAGQVVGFVDRDGQGIEGLERTFNAQLAGTPGHYALLRDARRKPLWLDAASHTAHADGQPLRLTLDLNLQQIAERELAASVEHFRAKAGQMVVLDPLTGDILAMANVPAIDPADAGNLDPALRRNRAVTDVFEPGSIFKPLVWAAATELGIADPAEMIDCSDQGWWKPDRGPVLRDAHPHGTISWEDVLVQSSNIGMGIVAERLGKQGLYDIVHHFGMGQSTHSGLPGELPGLLRKPDAWSWTDVTRIPMGQGIAVTPLQITRAFASIANDGILITPRITTTTPTLPALTAPPSRVLSPQIAQLTRQVLRRVMTDGTGRKANSKRYALFGKSGTAQLPDPVNGGYLENGYVSSFVAGAPLDRPRLVVGCFIHQPDKSIGHYGGSVAGPAVMRFTEQALDYLGQSTQLPTTTPTTPWAQQHQTPGRPALAAQ